MLLENLPQVALNKMNEIHSNEAEIINELLQAIEQKNESTIDTLLKEFIEDVKKHFSYEQEQMEKYEFIAYPFHLEEHERVLEELSELQDEWNENRNINNLKNYFETQFIPWLINHISNMDAVTAGFLVHYIKED